MDSKLIEKFFRRECTPEEVSVVLEWFKRQNAESWQEHDLHAIWKEAEREKNGAQFAHDSVETLKLIHQRIDQEVVTTAKPKHRSNTINLSESWSYALRLVAILAFPFLVTWLFLDHPQIQPLKESPSLITVETPPGVKRTTVLPDGSKITLNAHSMITYMSDSSTHTRELTLTGEAFFEVSKDPLNPFTVHTGGLSTTALGTSFNINYRPDRLLIEVSLVTGIVEVATKDRLGALKVTKLQPGERLTYHTQDYSFQVDNFDSQENLAWKEGILYFKKADIEQIVQQLEGWYGVEISLEGDLAKLEAEEWTYTGMFEDQSLEEVLTGISYVKSFSYEINDKNIKLIFN